MEFRNQVDLVLVNPGGNREVYQSLVETLTAVEPPVWVGLIATFLRRQGFSVCVLDAEAENLGLEKVADRIIDLKPLLTAVVVYGHQPSASTQNMPAAAGVCTALKQRAPERQVILLGGHVAALPERTLRETDADFVCGGEGPYTLLDLLRALKSTDPAFL